MCLIHCHQRLLHAPLLQVTASLYFLGPSQSNDLFPHLTVPFSTGMPSHLEVPNLDLPT